jgi:radical SAM protein with 4Fe4S-binding SPASM domain
MMRPINQFTREVQISLDGLDHATADALAGSPGYLGRAVDSIRNLAARDFNFRVKAVVTPLNAPRMYEWAQMLSDLGVRRISCAAYSRSYYRHDDSLFLSAQDRAALTEQFQRIRLDFPHIELIPSGFDQTAAPSGSSASPVPGDPAAAGLPGSPFQKAASWSKRSACSGGRTSLTILPDGKVTLCDTVPQTEMFVVGDLSRQSITEVWQNDALLSLAYSTRERFAGTPCYDCADRLECHILFGYCFRDSYFNYGSPYLTPPKCPQAPDDGLRMD